MNDYTPKPVDPSMAQPMDVPSPNVEEPRTGPDVGPVTLTSASNNSLVAAVRNPAIWIRALQTAGIGYAAAIVAALILGASIWIGGLSSVAGSLSGSLALPTGSSSLAPESLLAIMLQVISMGFGSSVTTSVAVWGANAQVTLGFMPLLVPLLSTAAVWVWSRIKREAGQPPASTLMLATVTGAILATVTLLLAAVAPWTITGLVPLTILAVSPSGWVGAFVLVGAATWFGARPGTVRPNSWAASIWGVVTAMGGLSFVVFLGLVVTFATHGALATLPLCGLNLVLLGDVVAMLGNVSMSSQVGTVIPGLSAAYGQGLSMFTPTLPGWAWLGVVLAVVFTISAGIVIYLRGGANGPAAIARAAGVWALVGLAVQLIAGVHFAASVGGLVAQGSTDASMNLGIGPSTLTFLVFAVWGAVVGVGAVWVAPRLAARLPASLIDLVQMGLAVGPALTPDPTVTPGAQGVSSTPQLAAPAATLNAQPWVPVVANAPLKPLSRRTKTMLGTTSALVVVLVAAAIAIPIVRSAAFGPESLVREYMAALETGDVAKAITLSGYTPVQSVEGSLLTNDIYSKATNRPSKSAISKVTVTGDTATIDVTYSTGSQTQHNTMTATRTSTAWLVVDHWKLDDGLPVASLSVNLEDTSVARDLTVNGIKLPDQVKEATQYAALPGTYQVEVAETKLLQGDSSTLNVPNGSASFTVRNRPTNAFMTAAMDAATKAVNDCAARTDYAMIDTCPFSAGYEASGSATNVSYKIVTMPTWSFDQVGSIWQVSSTKSGKVHIKYDYLWFGTSSTTSETDESFSAIYKVNPLADGTVVVILMD